MANNELDELIKERNLPTVIDEKANQESRDLVARSKRDRREQNAVHWSFIIILAVIVVGFGAAIMTRVLHLVLPERYCWLDDDHLKRINEFIMTGGIGGTVS